MHSWNRSCTGWMPRPGSVPGARYSMHCTGQNSGHLPQGKQRFTSMKATSRGRFFFSVISSGTSGTRSSFSRRLMMSMADIGRTLSLTRLASQRTREAMQVGVVVRNMGPQSGPETLVAAARAVDAAPAIADLWVTDHIAIPPDDAEGSGGRYLDPLATLAFLAGLTERVGLGTSVLVLPYRPPLPTAKWIASVQELSRGRLRLGVGAGWMAAEFRGLGVHRRHRGKLMAGALAFLDRCFADDLAEAHGQPFLFRPRPPRPPLFIGGGPPHAFRRALAHGAGWMPIGLDPDALRPLAADLRAQAAAAVRPAPEIAALTRLPLDDPGAARELLARYAEAGATRVIHGERYADAAACLAMLDRLARVA